MIVEAGPISLAIRRDRRGGDAIDMYVYVAPVSSFNYIDGSVFVQELNNNDNDNLTLTLHKTDGKRFRLPPVIHRIPRRHFTSNDQLKSYVSMKTRDSLYLTWMGHIYTYSHTMEAAAVARRHTAARNQLVNSFQNLNLDGGQ